MKRFSILATACALFAAPVLAPAAIHTYNNADLTTVPNAAGPNSDGTGVWFNPLTGYVESRGTTFPSPLFEDGKYFLALDASFTTPEAVIYTEGLFSRGNGVIYASPSNLNPIRLGDGAAIGPATGFQSAGAGYSDIGPTFGNWSGGGHGYLGLTIRDASSALATSVFYGYAEIDVNPTTFAVTLLSFAYNDVVAAPITTVSTVPEPTTAAAVLLGVGLLGRRRRLA